MLRPWHSKRQPQARRNASWLAQRGPGKQTRKVNHVEPVRQVRHLNLQRRAPRFLVIDFRARRHIERKIRPHAPARQIHAIQNLLSECCKQVADLGVANIRRQPAPVLRAHRQPGAPRRLKAQSSMQRISLILRHCELARIRQRVGRVASEEQPAGNWSLPDAGLIRIAQVAGKASPLRNLQADFLPENPRLGKRNRKAYAVSSSTSSSEYCRKSRRKTFASRRSFPKNAFVT